MNKGLYKVIFCRLRRMLVAVADFAVSHASEPASGTRASSLPVLRPVACAAMVLLGTVSTLTLAQIVPSAGSGAQVLQTQNGLQQVNIAKPSAAGVSLNNYSQFDVPGKGALLNNSPTIVQTQQAGYVNGNPNLAPGQSAGIIVNQVLSNSPSQLRGYLEVAGPKAEVIVANPSGIVVDGGGFINTSRAILTTGTPNFGANGSLAGFNVAGGNITVQGAGLNATNVDQVDLLARAVQVNAAIYANNLNVVAGANQVDHNTLAATPIAGNGAAPAVAIDVSQLGGMYASRIFLASNEYGVGVSNRGVLAAQAGDLTLTSQGKLVLAGQTNASGSISATARDGIDNSGTTYAQQDVVAATSGTLTNSGVLAAQRNTTINAGSVASTGTLGAGVNSDGSISTQGDLNVIASGAISASGRNAAGANAVVQGASVNLAGSSTTANGNLALTASAGDINLSSATTTAGGSINANATGTLANDNGALKSGGAQSINAGALSNVDGQIISGGWLSANIVNALLNQGGTMQSAGALGVRAGSVDNSAGHFTSLNADGLSVSASGLLNNAQGGVIGGNGDVVVQAGQLFNAGSITAVQDLTATATQSLSNAGTLAANGNATVTAGSTLTVAGGAISAGKVVNVRAATLDNSNGAITGDQVALAADSLVNHAGSVTQTGAGATTLAVVGTLDNANGSIQTNAADLSLAPAALINDNGKITTSGAGTLSINSGSLSNNGGTIATNGALKAVISGAMSNHGGTLQANGAFNAQAANIDNTSGRITSLSVNGLSITTTGLLNNGANGQIASNGNVTLQTGQLVNAGSIAAMQGLIARAVQTLFNSGTLAANGAMQVAAGTTLTNSGTIAGNQLALSAYDLVNRNGAIAQSGTAPTTFTVTCTLENTSGAIQTNAADLMLAPAALVNDNGTITSSGSGTLSVRTNSLSNNGGTIATNGALDVKSGSISNRGGSFAAQGNATLDVASLDNSAGGYVGARNVAIDDAGALNNSGGTLQANDVLGVAAQDMANDGGTIANGGSGTTSVVARGSLTNTNGGVIGGNGDVSIAGASVDNSGGTVVAAGSLVAQSNSGLLNRAGLIQAGGDVSVAAGGAIDNTGGQIEADGASSALSMSGASIDNSNGRIANSGAGVTSLGADSIVNSNANRVAGAGTIGGNGDVIVTARVLSNTQGAQTLAGHDLTLNVAQRADNSDATLSAANALALDAPNAALTNAGGSIRANGALGLNAASIDNTDGRIGNDQGSGGSVAITTGALSNTNGAIGSDQNLVLTAYALNGDGRIIAGNDGLVTINGDYTLAGVNQIQANHDLTFTTAGNFINQGTLAAVNALTVNAQNVDNQASADLNSANTTVNAASAITNEGRIEGDAVATRSATLVNTATIIGNVVTLNGTQAIVNDGAAAVMAAASQLNLYSTGDISNTNGANVFSLGDIAIGGDATRDANGLLVIRANTVTNDQSTIEAQGNIEVAANTLNNTRPAPTVATVTTDVETLFQTKRAKYMPCGTGGPDSHTSCTQEVWDDYYSKPRNDTFSAADVVSSTSGANAVDRMVVVNINGTPTTLYYNTLTTNADGTVTVNYWADYDPHINYDPATEYPGDEQAHKGWHRIEVDRTTTTTTQQDQIDGPQAQQAQLIAGGTMTLANVGTINNAYSAIAAGDAIVIGNAVQNGAVDGSGTVGGTTVNNAGQTLYQYRRQDIVSTYAWNEDISRDVDHNIVQPSVVPAPVAIGGTGGTIVANNAISITARDVNNTNVAAANSATGATGGTLGANTAMMSLAGGNAAGVSNATGASVNGASGASTSAATGNGATINAPQSVAGPAGALNIPLPTSGLYRYDASPNAAYLIATDPRLTSYTSFISSDYMLKALNFDPQKIEKRLGDGMYEEQLIRNQITQLTGRVYLEGYANNEDEYRALMNNGVNFAREFNLVPGMALTAAQMDALTSDIVWLVDQTVTLPDGTVQHVLAPVVYMAQAHANDLQPTGALISADDVEIHAAGSVTNSGVIKGGTQTVITGTDILNRGGRIGSDGTTVISATNDVINASGRISGNRVAVLAGNDIVNTTLIDAVGVSSSAGSSKVNQTLVGAQGTIESTGDMMVAAGHDLTVHGANISAGGNAQIAAGHDIVVDAVQSSTSQSTTYRADRYASRENTVNETSGISAGGSLAMQSGNDMTFKGAQVSAGTDMAVVAGGSLTATSVTDSAKVDDVYHSKKRSEEVHDYNEQAVGTNFSAGGDATLAAVSTDKSKGNVTLTGSSLTTETGAANIVATGDVTLNEAREEHDSYSYVHSERGSVVKKTTTDEMHDTQANIGVGSTVSGDSVNIQSGKDVTIQGSNVVGTHDVKLDAAGEVNITTSQDTERSQSYYEKRESGFLSGMTPLNQLDGGLQGYSIGTRKATDAQQATQVTNNGSMIGSLDGNLTVTSGKDLHVTGSTLHAADDVSLTGKTVTIDAAQNASTQGEQQSFSQTGITAGLSSPIIAAVQTANQMRKDVKQTKGDARLDALAAATTGLAGKNAADAVTADPSHLGGVGVSVSLGTSHSHSNTSGTSSTASGSTISAGNDVRITATGAGANGNIDVTGSDITAGRNATLDAQGRINLQAAQSTDSMRSDNSASSGSIGATFGVGGAQNGLSFQLGVSGSKGHGNGDDATWTNTHVNAGDTLTLQSGGDTNLRGATADGQQVVANVGGNLNIESLQDTSHYDSKQTSGGVSVSVCVPPICAGASSVAANFDQQKLNSDYASVAEQSGIHAGDGGFAIDVKGNTDLKGAVIASDADASRNSLTTGTLTYSDIENHASYSGSSIGLSGGYGGGIGKDQKGTATNVNPVGGTTLPSSGGASVAPPVVMSASGDASSTTKSAISGGTIRITDDAKQQQLSGQTADEAVANVSRDATNTGNALKPIFDRDKIEAGFDITSQFVNQAGTFVANRAKEADAASAAAKDPNLTPEQRAQAQQQADQLNAEWGPGGTYRQVLSALTVAAGGNVTGGMSQYAQTATVAYLQELGANEVKQIADNLGSEGARAALHAVVGCAGGAASGASCGAGAMGAAASSVIGSLLAPSDSMSAADRLVRENLVNSLVAGVATSVGASGADVATAAGAAQIELENNQVSILAKKNPLSVDLVKSMCGTGTCTDEQVKQLVQTQGQMNGAAGKNAVVVAGGVAVAAVVAAVPALASLAPDALALALSNPAAAVNAGIITAETAAAIVTNSVTPSVAVEGAAAKAGATANAANDAIQFGRVENQVSHTFRHIEAAGFDRDVVQSAVQTDLSRLADSIPQGQYIGSVTVNGVKLDYSAFKLPDGTINVGRITPPRTN